MSQYRIHHRITRRHALACIALAASALSAPAMAWTDKPVRLIVPAPPGGTMDVAARIIGDQLALDLKVPVIVENKPGAGGGIAMQALGNAAADGQTLVVTASNVLTEIPHVMKNGFEPLRDARPVAAFGRSTAVLVGPANGPADFKALLAYCKANPGKLSFASYSAGTSSHYAGMILNQKAGLDLTHVPFAGSPPALQQMMGGTITLMFDGMVTSLPQVKGGKLRAYAVASRVRSALLPDLPTTAELGYPEIDFSNWVGVVASARMAPELADKINAAVLRAADSARVKERLHASGFDAIPAASAAELAKTMRAEYDRNAGIVKTFNIQLNP